MLGDDGLDRVGVMLSRGPDAKDLSVQPNLAIIASMIAEIESSYVLNDEGDNIRDNPVQLGALGL